MAKNVGSGCATVPTKLSQANLLIYYIVEGGGGTYRAKKTFLKDDFQWNLCMMSLAMTCGYIFKNFDLIFLGPEGGGVWISTTKMLKQRDRGQ